MHTYIKHYYHVLLYSLLCFESFTVLGEIVKQHTYSQAHFMQTFVCECVFTHNDNISCRKCSKYKTSDDQYNQAWVQTHRSYLRMCRRVCVRVLGVFPRLCMLLQHISIYSLFTHPLIWLSLLFFPLLIQSFTIRKEVHQ